jgi:serine/threonine protein phosphatase PrpC
MQGWRSKMEDAHITDILDNICIFGVFDGHGGYNS